MRLQFQSLTDFMSMGGHGGYVWACYLFTVLTVAVLIYWPSLKRRQLIKQIARLQRIVSNQR